MRLTYLILSIALASALAAQGQGPSVNLAEKPEPSQGVGRASNLALAFYGGLPYANSIVARERIRFLGANLRFGYTLPKPFAGRLALVGQMDIQRFLARSLPAWGFVPQTGLGLTVWQKSAHMLLAQATGGMALGRVERKEEFRIGVAELASRYSYGFSQQWALVVGLRQQFYFDPVGFFTASLFAIGINYAF
ncbi:MAG: hypothetical protein NZM25_07630 [Leptospiraceae bacterium]|nr:hypothetical protein [Leptospiraceae bacterium]MDW8305469.1 hypothetical protein [Leptospiraceae bacterium]